MDHNCGVVDATGRENEDAAAVRGCGCGSVDKGNEGDALWRRSRRQKQN